MTLAEIQLLAVLLERAQHTFSPVEIAWVNALLDRERQRAEIEAQLLAAQKEAMKGDA